MNHEVYMQRCLQLAQMGAGEVSPNPMVGAVLVYNENIIGEGYHQRYGEAHAEVNCLNSVHEKNMPFIPESTLYVSLEPCVHFGKTPPCTDLILSKKIQKVVVACTDPFEKVNGGGIQKLIAQGVDVTTGILEKEAKELNRRFFHFHTMKRPYIILKWAQSADRFISGAQGRPVQITGVQSNRLVHQWRAEEDAILVGKNTVQIDDPALTTRLWPGKNPLRVVLDPNNSLNPAAKIFDNAANTIIFNTHISTEKEKTAFVKVSETNFLQGVLDHLYERNILSLIVEGGSKTLQSFIDADLWQEACVFTNPTFFLHDGTHAPHLHDDRAVCTIQAGGDQLQRFQPV